MGSRLMAVICFILAPATGFWRIVTENSPIEALLGENVTLLCLLSGISTPLNLQIVGVYWTQKSLNRAVYKVYQFESFAHTKFRLGSNMNNRDLLKGNASLYIPRVQISDEGKYRCRVIVSPHDDIATYPLLVSGKPQVVVTDSVSVDLGSERSVTCNLTRFYPKAVTIRWVKHSKLSNTRSSLDGDTYFTVPAENSDGTFNVTSLLTVRPSSTEETGDEYSCIVTHRSLKSDTELRFTLTVEGRHRPLNFRLSVISLALLCPSCLLLGILLSWLWKPWKLLKNTMGSDRNLNCMRGVNPQRPDLDCRRPPDKFTVSGMQRRIYTIHMMKEMQRCYTDAKLEDLQVSIYLKRRNDAIAMLAISCDYKDQSAQNSEVPKSLEGIPSEYIFPPMEMALKIEDCGNGCICSLEITPDADRDDGAELTLQFRHHKSPQTVSRHQTLRVLKVTAQPADHINRKKASCSSSLS